MQRSMPSRRKLAVVGGVTAVAVAAIGLAVGEGATGGTSATPGASVNVELPSEFAHNERAAWAVADLSSAEISEFEHWSTQLKINYLTEAVGVVWNPNTQPTASEVHALQAYFLKTETGSAYGLGKLTPQQLAKQQQMQQAATQAQQAEQAQSKSQLQALVTSGSGYENLPPGQTPTATSRTLQQLYLYTYFQPPLEQLNPVGVFVCMNPASTTTHASFLLGAVAQVMGPNGPEASNTEVAWTPMTWSADSGGGSGGMSLLDTKAVKTVTAPAGVVLNGIAGMTSSGVLVTATNGQQYDLNLANGSLEAAPAGGATSGAGGTGPRLCLPVNG